jgi:hypothetical protein
MLAGSVVVVVCCTVSVVIGLDRVWCQWPTEKRTRPNFSIPTVFETNQKTTTTRTPETVVEFRERKNTHAGLVLPPESFRVRFLAKPKQNGEDVEREKIRLETAERTCCQPDGLKATELVASNGLPRKLCLLTLCVCCCCTGGEEEGTGEMVGGGKEVNLGAGITLFLFLPFPSCVTATTTSHRLFFPLFYFILPRKNEKKTF